MRKTLATWTCLKVILVKGNEPSFFRNKWLIPIDQIRFAFKQNILHSICGLFTLILYFDQGEKNRIRIESYLIHVMEHLRFETAVDWHTPKIYLFFSQLNFVILTNQMIECIYTPKETWTTFSLRFFILFIITFYLRNLMNGRWYLVSVILSTLIRSKMMTATWGIYQHNLSSVIISSFSWRSCAPLYSDSDSIDRHLFFYDANTLNRI